MFLRQKSLRPADLDQCSAVNGSIDTFCDETEETWIYGLEECQLTRGVNTI